MMNSLLADFCNASNDNERVGVRIWPYAEKLDIKLYQSHEFASRDDEMLVSSASRMWAEISESLKHECDFTKLDIDGVLQKDLNSAFSIAKQCPNLTDFKMRFAFPLDERGPDAPVLADDFTALASFMENSVVARLVLDFRWSEGVMEDAFDAMCKALSLGKAIRVLTLDINADFSDPMMKSLGSMVASLPHLRELTFLCKDFGPALQAFVPASFAKLEALSLHVYKLSTEGGRCLGALCILRCLRKLSIHSFSARRPARKHLKRGLRQVRASELNLYFPNDCETLVDAMKQNMYVTEATCHGRYQLDGDNSHEEHLDSDDTKQHKRDILATQQDALSLHLLRNNNLLAQWQSLAAVCRPTADFLPCVQSCIFRSAIFKFFLPKNFTERVAWPGMPASPATSDIGVQAAVAMEVEPSNKGSSRRKRSRAQHQVVAEVAPEEMSHEEKQTNSDLMRAIQQSKAESVTHPLNADGVVLLRLSRMARSPRITDLFQHSPHLEVCRARMAEVNHTMFPEWTEARLLVPLLEDDFREHDIELHFDNVVALKSDIEAIKAALKTLNDCGRQRPTLQFADPQAKRQRTTDATNYTPNQPSQPAASSSSQARQGQEDDSDEDMPVLVSLVSALSLRTNSSVGFPANPYIG